MEEERVVLGDLGGGGSWVTGTSMITRWSTAYPPNALGQEESDGSINLYDCEYWDLIYLGSNPSSTTN